MYFFLIAYTVLGAGIKYIDDAFDEKTFNKTLALIITPLLSILGVYAMMIDPVSATILLAVVCGVFIKGKVYNYAFLTGGIIVISLAFVLGINFLIIPLIILSTAAVLDEVGNDFIDRKKHRLNMRNPAHIFARYFFGHRWIMKTAIIFLVILNIVPVFFVFAMILFDYSYLGVTAYSNTKEKIPDATSMQKAIATVGYIFK